MYQHSGTAPLSDARAMTLYPLLNLAYVYIYATVLCNVRERQD